MNIAQLVVAAGIHATPNPNGLPGSPALQSLIDGLAFWGLLAALAGLVVSAAAAFLIGAAPALVTFFENLGNTVH